MSFPPDLMGFSGPATRNTVQVNMLRRAQFAVAAARRITTAGIRAVSHNESAVQAIAKAATAERHYYGQHLIASWNRMRSAAAVDTAASTYGLLLGWRTVLDSHTSPECRAANGLNFRADIMPRIGYPGSVHPHCRCYAGRPVPGARLLA
jgi:Phage Mu protein F like protein